MTTDKMPWDRELHFKQFWHFGYLCTILRGPLYHLCGYVRVEKDHPAALKPSDFSWGWDDNVKVHGGITYSGKTLPGSENADGFYLGFDCSHHNDMYKGSFSSDAVYRDIDYVTNECKSLAEQLLKMKEISHEEGNRRQVGQEAS